MNYKNFSLLYHLNSHRLFFWLFIFAFSCQIIFWKKTENFHTPLEIVPPAPSGYFVSAASFGDKEFLFRTLGMRLQNSGDVFAGFLPLKKYDYSRIYQWMKALDHLNSKSTLIPALASYYYSQTTKYEDTRYVVDYLDEHSSVDIDDNWWWMMQATFIAKNSLKDYQRALELAEKLAQNNNNKAPLWTKEMPAFIKAEVGDNCLIFGAIARLIAENESGKRQISAEEMNFMRNFLNYRLEQLKKQKFDPRKCSMI
jgi:hypothetical protein